MHFQCIIEIKSRFVLEELSEELTVVVTILS